MDSCSRDAAFEARLKRDLAVLTTLAQLGCATFPQLYALCFPHCVVATARVALANLTAAGYLANSRWYLKQATRERGQVWTMTPRGSAILQRYVTLPDTLPEIDLGCPSTSVEYDVWRARIQARTLIVALILEARRSSFLTGLQVTLTHGWSAFQREACRPDTLLTIGWRTPTTQTSDWLPWWPTPPRMEQGVQYPVYLDRATGTPPLGWLHAAPPGPAPEQPWVPLLILDAEDRYAPIQDVLVPADYRGPLRWSTWETLRAGAGAGRWRDAQGRACALTL